MMDEETKRAEIEKLQNEQHQLLKSLNTQQLDEADYARQDARLKEVWKQLAKLREAEETPHGGEDLVNHPAHYTFGRFEVIDVLEDWFATDPLLWQAGKYMARAGRKGPALADLEKAEWYLKRRIEKERAGGGGGGGVCESCKVG